MFTSTITGCDTAHFSNQSTTPIGTNIISYSWNFGDGSSSFASSPVHIYINYGTFEVKLKIVNSNGCVDSVLQQITITPKPVADFSISPLRCTGSPVNFTDQSFMPAGFLGSITNWFWDFGDGNTSTLPNPTHVFSGTSTTYSVRLTVTATTGCKGFNEKLITFVPSPVADFTESGALCQNQMVQFDDLSQPNGGGSLLSWSWNFGDPLSGASNTSTQQNPAHLFSGTGPYPIMLIVTNSTGCSDTLLPMPTVSLAARPVADFTTSATRCDTVSFTDNSTTPAGTTLTSYLWNFGDGGFSTQTSPSHIYTTYGTFSVKLKIVNSNGCADSVVQQVTVNPKPVADFSFPPVRCTGSSVSFTDHSFLPPGFTGYISGWLWNFGDGTTSPLQSPSHVFPVTANTYLVRLTVTSTTGCIGFNEKTVTLVPSPVANFTESSPLCQNQSVQFSDLSQENGGGNIQRWNWNFGDPLSGAYNTSTIQNPTHSFSGTGSFNISLIVTNANGCKDTLLPIPQITLNARPLSNFKADTVCQGSLTTFTDLSIPNSGTIIARLWDFGNGQTSTAPNPTNLYATSGVFIVKLTVTNTNGCAKDTTKQILVLGKPVSAFTNSASNCAGDSVQFVDLSYTPHGWLQEWTWDFGAGTIVGPIVFPTNKPRTDAPLNISARFRSDSAHLLISSPAMALVQILPFSLPICLS
ncbi:MAG: PKD domain-containing protein [Bacteroidetes bacterium]|nr:PKD domain-containing protein [Bacteroidota bacterium]